MQTNLEEIYLKYVLTMQTNLEEIMEIMLGFLMLSETETYLLRDSIKHMFC